MMKVLPPGQEEHPGAPRADVVAKLKSLQEEWRAMGKAARAHAVSALGNAGAQVLPPIGEGVCAQAESAGRGDPGIWDLGSRDWPVREAVIADYAHEHASHNCAGVAGFANKASRIRKAESSALLVRDGGDVPDARTYQHRHSCSELHFGLCAHADSAIYSDALAFAKSLESFFAADMLHKYFCCYNPEQDHCR